MKNKKMTPPGSFIWGTINYSFFIIHFSFLTYPTLKDLHATA